MRFKSIVLVLGALLMLTACESMTKENAGASGQGAKSGGGSGGGVAAIVPGSVRDLVVNVGDRVFFDFDKSDLKPDARATLEKQAAWLKRFPGITVTLEGHCDERGTREYNLALGERRANAAKDFLVALGINPGRVNTVSYGKERPVAFGHDEAAWAQNRRAVMTVTGGGAGS